MHCRRSLDQRLVCTGLLPPGIVLRAASVQPRFWHPCRSHLAPTLCWGGELAAESPSFPHLVKDGGWVETGVPSCDEYSLPWPVKQRRGLRRAPLLPNRIAESPPPGHRFCHRGQASNVVVPTRPAARKGSKVGGRFDGEKKDRKRSLTRIFLGPRTEEEGRTGRLSSRSAFQTAYEHNHGRVRPLVDCRRWHR